MPQDEIVFDREISTSKYYEKLVSAEPLSVFFPGQDNYGSFTWYGDLDSKKPDFFKALCWVRFTTNLTEVKAMLDNIN